MSGKMIGNVAIGAGLLIAILTIHLWTIIAIGLVIAGGGVRAVSGSNRGTLTSRARKSLL